MRRSNLEVNKNTKFPPLRCAGYEVIRIAKGRKSQIFLRIRVELVPPKPNELERKQLIFCSLVSGIMLILAESSSGFSKLILGAKKLFCIISSEYTISLAPAIQHSWPVMDLVELTGTLSPKTSKIALASLPSPTGVEVACALM